MRVDGDRAAVEGRNWTYTAQLHKGSNPFHIKATKHGYSSNALSLTVERKLSAAERAQIAAQKRATFIASTVTIPYKQLIKDPDRYSGEKVAYHGQIFQIQESGGSGVVLLSVTDEGYGFWTDNVWVNYDGSVRGGEGDMLTVYGTVVGNRSYETQIGGETYVPEIDAKYIAEG